VALGEAPADLLLTGGQVVNVYTGEVLRTDLAVAGGHVAAVAPDLRSREGSGTERLDLDGKVVVPGFIDGHTHLDVWVTLPALLAEAIPRGLTGVVTEMAQLVSALGTPGARWFLDGLRGLPIHAYATLPVISHLSTDDSRPGEPRRPVIDAAALAALLEDPAVRGLGEVYWHRLVPEPAGLLPLIERARTLGKTVEGHSAGARGPRLGAFAALGVGSCHEPITAEEALERLRLGLFVLIREGSVRRDLAAVLGVRERGVSLRRAALCSDGVWPTNLLADGYLDVVVQRAIDQGLDPVTAYQMVSLNVAEHFGLDGEMGGLAPGRSADCLVLPDLRTVRPEVVVARGRVVARDGRCLLDLPVRALPSSLYAGPEVGPLDPAGLALEAPGGSADGRARVRVIRLTGDIVTAADEAVLPVRQGTVQADPGQDCLLAAVLNRRGSGRRGLGVVRGFGLREGALASTLSFDTADLVLVGASPAALAAAARRVVALGGGFVVVDGQGRVRAELPLPVGGVASPAAVPEVAGGIRAVDAALDALGCRLRRPLLTIQTLTFAAIPAIRLTARGLLDVKARAPLPVILGPGP
jgi:adenine deaminase